MVIPRGPALQLATEHATTAAAAAPPAEGRAHQDASQCPNELLVDSSGRAALPQEVSDHVRRDAVRHCDVDAFQDFANAAKHQNVSSARRQYGMPDMVVSIASYCRPHPVY